LFCCLCFFIFFEFSPLRATPVMTLGRIVVMSPVRPILVVFGFRRAVIRRVALVLTDEFEVPSPFLKGVLARRLLTEMARHGLDLGDEQEVEVGAGGEVVEGVP